MTTEEFKRRLCEVNDSIAVEDIFMGTNNKMKVRCKICDYRWDARPYSLLAGTGCPKCANRLRITNEEFVERLRALNPNVIPLTRYVNNNTGITLRCGVCGYVWTTKPYHLTKTVGRTGCPKCSNKARRSHEDFVREVKRLSPDIEILGTYVARRWPISVRCLKCDRVWNGAPGSLLKGTGCKRCKMSLAIQGRKRKIKCRSTGEVFNTLKEASEKYGISTSAICNCCKKKTKHAAGLEWEYVLI